MSSTAPQKSANLLEAIERVCIETVEAGDMTKDLAMLVSPEQKWLTTQDFLGAIDARLQGAMK